MKNPTKGLLGLTDFGSYTQWYGVVDPPKGLPGWEQHILPLRPRWSNDQPTRFVQHQGPVTEVLLIPYAAMRN